MFLKSDFLQGMILTFLQCSLVFSTDLSPELTSIMLVPSGLEPPRF